MREKFPYWSDGTQSAHWRISHLTEEEMDAIDIRLMDLAPVRLSHAACVHDPSGYLAYHRLRAFRRARTLLPVARGT